MALHHATAKPAATYPLSHIKVLELEGIGPGPLGCCMLADFGADVVTVSRVSKGRVVSQHDPVSRGKRSIALDLKSPSAITTFITMAELADVVVDPFRPGVMEKLGLGPEVLCAANPGLIFARMTGWGQTGDSDYVSSAGHDANYISVAGTLSLFRKGNDRPLPPANLAGDYAGGGVMLAMGVLLALMERQKSGRGQVVDVAMTDGANYVALPLFKWLQPGGILRTRSDGFLDTNLSFLHQAPHFSTTYTCKDGKWVSVQCLEPHFYKVMISKLGLNMESLPSQFDRDSWPEMTAHLQRIFLTRTRDEWEAVFKGSDACVAPVLSTLEAPHHPHNIARSSFAPTPEHPGLYEPCPAPKLCRTPGHKPRPKPKAGEHTQGVLLEYGILPGRVSELLESGAAVDTSSPVSKL